MSEKYNRIVLIVLDGFGVGELPDADEFGDVGSNTLRSIDQGYPLNLPHLESLGLGNLGELKNLKNLKNPKGYFGKMNELSPGKDTTVGHWEISGVVASYALPTYPQGFPEDLMEQFRNVTGYEYIGNKTASGTTIIAELGDEHVQSDGKKLIVYTSADSVFQIAAHEEYVPLEKLYAICEQAREILKDEHGVGRVIARPFIGTTGSYKRTAHRHDFSLFPPAETVLDKMVEKNLGIIGIGKIYDIFAGQSVSESTGVNKDNADGIEKTLEAIKKWQKKGLIFTNLVDFDMAYGHRRDIEGYGKCLEEFDRALPEILESLNEDDLLILTADHGTDPGYVKHSDHTREYVPLLVYGKTLPGGKSLGIRNSFTDIAATIAENFELVDFNQKGSFLKELK